MRPLGKRVLIRHAKKGRYYDMASQAIAIPDKYRGTANEGIVLAVGNEVPEVKPGWRVLFEKRSGQIVRVGDQNLKILKWEDLLAVVDVGKVKLCPTCGGQGTLTEVPDLNIGDPTTDEIGG